jgi:hypothetical protein
MDDLLRLIDGARADAAPARLACADGHHWQTEGGRACPQGAEGCSQAVYRCAVCGTYDYGSGADSPGEIDCKAACGDSLQGWRGGPLDPDPDNDSLEHALRTGE